MNEKPRPVIFSRPDNWDEWTHERKIEYAGKIADAMGFTGDEQPEQGGEDREPPPNGTIVCSGMARTDLEIEEGERLVGE